ncbi:MAG TPA: cbb3-type cytochrome c oxidase subunit 3 [Burkholderiales bacterium]|nr:cbb3-type cytochrome c oxidase subunit 3 [Burkholderiales bacterium]
MDLNMARTVMTVVAFVTFVGILAWAWSSRRTEDYARAARAALDDDQPQPGAEERK